ncbi:MAG: lysozyme [Rickettsiales bacterium]
MKTSKNGIELIKRFEGFSAEPYYCPAGKLTIGYGHVMSGKEREGLLTISKEIAENLLKKDIEIAEKTIARLVKIEITQGQFDALVSFIYNIGNQAFEKSTLLRILNDGETELAAGEFKRWVYSKGKRLRGLVKRREAEKLLFFS